MTDLWDASDGYRDLWRRAERFAGNCGKDDKQRMTKDGQKKWPAAWLAKIQFCEELEETGASSHVIRRLAN